jgi:subtilisin family serine protease
MSRFTEWCIVLFVGLFLGCRAPDVTTSNAQSPLSGLDAACPKTRYVAQRTTLDCPAISQWQLRDEHTPEAAERSTFCIYDAENPGSDPQLVADHPSLSHASPDCRIVSPLMDVSTNAMWTALSQSFSEQSDAPLVPASTSRVRVAIVDTAPEQALPVPALLSPDRTGHGTAVSRIITEVACRADTTGAGCPARLVSGLAMPRSADVAGTDEVTGGDHGTLVELALAIDRVVEAYRTTDPVAREAHLIINLSLGWDPYYAKWEGDDKYASSQLVRASLRRAVCHGALVIAAAGNDSGGPNSRGAMYPAAWETEAAPSVDECKRLLGEELTVAYPTDRPAYRPLINAIGGVMGDGRPLPNGRVDSRPRLVAPAAFAVAAAPPFYDRPTRVLTGTSAAAAVASAAAVLVWSRAPALDAAEVMDILFRSAVPTGWPTDVCVGASCPGVESRRISACRAYADACSAKGCGSFSVSSCRPKQDWRPVITDAHRAVFSAADRTSAAGTPRTVTPLEVCGANAVLTVEDADPTWQCPDRQLTNAVLTPYTGPQPGSNPCRTCGVQRVMVTSPTRNTATSVELYIEIGNDAGDDVFENPVLHVPGVGYFVAPGVKPLRAGDMHIVTDIAIPDSVPLSEATLLFTRFSADGELLGASESPLLTSRFSY